MKRVVLLDEKDEKILVLLRRQGPKRKAELSEMLGIPLTTVQDHLNKLVSERYLEKFYVNEGKRGRPKAYYKIKMRRLFD